MTDRSTRTTAEGIILHNHHNFLNHHQQRHPAHRHWPPRTVISLFLHCLWADVAALFYFKRWRAVWAG